MFVTNKMLLGLSLTIIIISCVACNSNEVKNPSFKKSPSTTETKNFIPEGYTADDEDLYGSPLFYVLALNRLKEAEKLLKAGADVNASNPLNQTPLEKAIEKNSTSMVHLLLKHGARPNYLKGDVSCNVILATASSGETRFDEMPLDDARKKGNTEIIKLLKQAGAKSFSDCTRAGEQERKLIESLQPRP